MKEFDLSDKELKSLLQEDGLETPSMGFNKAILSKIDTYEKKRVTPLKAPKWLILALMTFLIAPSFFFLSKGNWDSNSVLKGIELPSLNFDLAINTTYLWISVLTVAVIGLAMLFDRFLLNSPPNRS